MGEVFLAQHSRIDRRAAIKVLLPEFSSNVEVVERFFAEARATSTIRHRGIVEVLDCDVHPNGRAFIVMELLEGESLAARLSRDADFGRDRERAFAIAGDIADAIGAAHAKGIVHRDLKPDNVFLASDERAPFGFTVKILDFGIAKLMGGHDADRPGSPRTRTGSLLGTPAYMSPEQCRGAAHVDHRTDIYSLGCIVFEMLAGRRPFVYEGFGELISAHITQPPPSLGSLGIEISAPLAEWVDRLLAKSPDDRFPSMTATISALREAAHRTTAVMAANAIAEPARPATAAAPLSGRPASTSPSAGGTAMLPSPAPAASPSGVGARPPSTPGTSVLPSGPAFVTNTTLSASVGEHLPARGGRRRAWAWAAGAAALAAVAGGGALVLSSRGTNAPKPAAPNATPAKPETVTITISDAPTGLRAWVDGTPAELPIQLPAGADKHDLTFRAPGFEQRTLTVDGTESRLLTLTLKPSAADEPPEPVTAPGAAEPATKPSRPDRPATGDGNRHRRRGAGPADTGVDIRKL